MRAKRVNNSADRDGGAIHVYSGNIISSNDQYINNTGDSNNCYSDGGAINVNSGDTFSSSVQYINNHAVNGGAVYVYSGNIYNSSDQYINNSVNSGELLPSTLEISIVLVITT